MRGTDMASHSTPVSRRRVRRPAPPRKVVVASAIWGVRRPYPGLSDRLEEMAGAVAELAARAARRFGGAGLDLALLPEYAVTGSRAGSFERSAIPLSRDVLGPMGEIARRHRCYLVLPLHMAEEGWRIRYFNAAALLDRRGSLIGVYRYVHPSVGELENKLLPGGDFPVFECDFGRVGIQISNDVRYADGWRVLARKGAELVAFPSQPPYATQVAARAMENRLFVLGCPLRGSAILHDPLGQEIARTGPGERFLVEQIDLAYSVLGWHKELQGGHLFDETYGTRAGYRYYQEEDWGIFWSNDPKLPIAEMVRFLGLRTLDTERRTSRHAQKRARGRSANHR
jgi:predicted amidohydrolase